MQKEIISEKVIMEEGKFTYEREYMMEKRSSPSFGAKLLGFMFGWIKFFY